MRGSVLSLVLTGWERDLDVAHGHRDCSQAGNEAAMAIDYAYEKMFNAILRMVTSSHSLQDRLADAYVHHIASIEPARDLPPDCIHLYRAISDTLVRQLGAEEEAIVAAAAEMPESDAVDVAHAVMRLFDEVVDAYRRCLPAERERSEKSDQAAAKWMPKTRPEA
jgi:hypothetical protein